MYTYSHLAVPLLLKGRGEKKKELDADRTHCVHLKALSCVSCRRPGVFRASRSRNSQDGIAARCLT